MHMQCHVYLATEAATPLNGTVMGDRPWLGGPTAVMLSAIDGPPGPSMAAVHGPRGPSMAAALGLGTDCGGTIGSMIVLILTKLQIL